MRQHCVQFNNAIQANFEPLKSPSVLTSCPRDATISYFLCYKPSTWCAAIQTSYHLRHCMLESPPGKKEKRQKKTKKRQKKGRLLFGPNQHICYAVWIHPVHPRERQHHEVCKQSNDLFCDLALQLGCLESISSDTVIVRNF